MDQNPPQFSLNELLTIFVTFITVGVPAWLTYRANTYKTDIKAKEIQHSKRESEERLLEEKQDRIFYRQEEEIVKQQARITLLERDRDSLREQLTKALIENTALQQELASIRIINDRLQLQINQLQADMHAIRAKIGDSEAYP